MLWVDKYRPHALEDLSYHDHLTMRLQSLASTAHSAAAMPHLLVYGPPGSGKKTRITALLRALYGPAIDRLKLDKRTFVTPTNRTVEINLITSPYHLELSPGDAGINDRFVVQDVIKEIASTRNVLSAAGGVAASSTVTTTTFLDGNKSQNNNNKAFNKSTTATTTTSRAVPDFKTVVLTDVDRLSRQAQAALRRTMEKYATTCRLILCCNSPSKVIEPVRSRCLGIRIPAPNPDQISHVLQEVAKQEKITLDEELAINIARESSRNVRRALLMLEACYVQNRNQNSSAAAAGGGGGGAAATQRILTKDQPIVKTDWELYIRQIAVDITREQSPQRLLATREKLYELLVNCIPADMIIKTLARELLHNLDDSLKLSVMEWAAFYEHRLSMGSKEIFHLEAFVAKYMALYKKYLNELFD